MKLIWCQAKNVRVSVPLANYYIDGIWDFACLSDLC